MSPVRVVCWSMSNYSCYTTAEHDIPSPVTFSVNSPPEASLKPFPFLWWKVDGPSPVQVSTVEVSSWGTCYVMSRRYCFAAVLPILWLLKFFFCSLTMFPKPWGRRGVTQMSQSGPSIPGSLVLCILTWSLYINYCPLQEMFPWWLRDELTYSYRKNVLKRNLILSLLNKIILTGSFLGPLTSPAVGSWL